MEVRDLNRQQIDELKEIYFNQLLECDEDVLGGIVDSMEIPDEVIFNHY